jgi:rhodanese-related sulfurtransferase
MKKQNITSTKKTIPVWGWIVFVLILAAVISLVVFQLLTKPASAALPTEVSVDQAAKMRDQGAFILDVRQPEEWAQFHLAGATLIPLGELPNRLNEVPKDRNVVVVCRTGHRSAQGRDILLNAGFTLVTSMTGGLTAWQAQGLPVVTGP